MKKQIHPSIGLIFFGLLMLAGSVLAQPSDPLAQYREFRPANDIASWVMQGLLGSVYESPFAPGAANTLFGQIFIVFNMIVFSAGVVWGSYGVLSAVAQTAHEGTAMGRRISPLWFPIRMAIGIGSLVPAFGGFSLAQIIMIVATSWGISFGNYAFNQATSAAANFTALTNPAIVRGANALSADDAVKALFEQRRCEYRLQAKLRAYEASGMSPSDDILLSSETISTAAMVGRASGTVRAPLSCGLVGVEKTSDTGRWANSAVGFRNAAVNYEAIAQNSWNAYSANFQGLISQAYALADQYERELAAAKSSQSQNPVSYPNAALRALSLDYMQRIDSAQTQTNVKAIHADALTAMQDKGFFAAGSYYSTLAEVNAAIMQATNGVGFVVRLDEVFGSAYSQSNPALPNAQLSPEFGNVEYGGTDQTSQSAKTSGRQSWCPLPMVAETGNCSLGQWFIKQGLNVATAGAGGAPNLVDPIIAAKNLGDYMMVAGETMGAAGAAAKVGSDAVSKIPLVGKAAAFVTGLVSTFSDFLIVLAGLLFAVGALLALYIPLVPFLNWVSAIVQYCCIVVEAMAAGSLHALAHLQSDGEGLGQRTEKGYLYLLNLLFRPVLMVAGFFAASILTILVGSAVFQMFAGVVANVQGNSITGLFSIIGFLFIFFVIMNIIIQGMFNLCYELADDVIGWIGGIGRNNIGRDTEGKVAGVFLGGARFGSGAMGSIKGGAGGGGNSASAGDKK